jgi:radical SAM superfamily enzyme YgiQ (UPF0313 family)
MFNAFIINLGSSIVSGRTLGPYLIATHLRQEGWDVEVIDYGMYWSLEELKELSRSRINSNTKFIGFGHLFVSWTLVLEEYCKWIKSTYPEIILIGGSGVNPTFTTSVIDYHIQGYGEYAISALLKYLFSNGDPIKFSLINTGATKVIPANDFYPAFPKKSLLAKYEDRDFIEKDEWLTIETSRGCVFSCDFCNFPILGIKGDYTRDALDFELEIKENYDRFGVKNYNLVDETFNDRTEKITKYADVVEKLNFVPFFTGFIRADLLVARPKDREELLRMNFLGHYYGIETFNRASGKIVGKGMETAKLQEGLKDVKNYFENNGRKLYRGTISLIAGLPEETFETLENTRQWLIKNWQHQCFYMYSLEIPNNKNDTFSKFSKDYQKYGYSHMTAEEINGKDFTQFPYNQYQFANGLGVETILWKNKNMNIFQATEIVVEFQKLYSEYQFASDGWTLSSPCLTGEVEDRLHKFFVYDLTDKVFHARLRRYITGKLSI